MFPVEFRAIDGRGNDRVDGGEGASGDRQIRITDARYADGRGALAPGPNPGAISDAVSAHPAGVAAIPDPSGSNMLFSTWGQFLTHDLGQVPTSGTDVLRSGAGGFRFEDGTTLDVPGGFRRALFAPGTGTTDVGGDPVPRAALNNVTAWLDGSVVYGSSEAVRDRLVDAATGRMRLGADGLLPLGTNGAFDAGDSRVAEHTQLSAIHTIFAREHNAWVERFAAEDPSLSAAQRFERAKVMVEAILQRITYEEYLPRLLGEDALAPWTGYREAADPQQSLEFSGAAFRIGHTMTSSAVLRRNEDGSVADGGDTTLAATTFNRSTLEDQGDLASLLRGMAVNAAQALDPFTIDTLRNRALGTDRLDLIALDILRGRDYGLGTYAQLRAELGLGTVRNFADISGDPAVQARLAAAYDEASDVDAWVGIVAERKVAGSMLGAVAHAIVVEQFVRLRDADRFWFEARLASEPLLLEEVRNTSLADIVLRNSDVDVLYRDPFEAVARIGGGAGADALQGTASADLLLGLVGNDRIDGGGGADDLHGGDGNDVLLGGAGDDWIGGGLGADRMDGGPGFDTVSYAFLGIRAFLDLAAGSFGSPDVPSGTLLERIRRFENAEGGAGDDRIRGTQIANDLEGNGGDDLLQGRDGDDLLKGGAGDDRLDGGPGDDVLQGGAGRDLLLGGPGTDTAVFLGETEFVRGRDRQGEFVVATGPEGIDVLRGIERVRAAGVERSLDELLGPAGATRIVLSQATLAGGVGQDHADSFAWLASSPLDDGLGGAALAIAGVPEAARVERRTDADGAVEVVLRSGWNSVKNVALEDPDGGRALVVDFVDVAVSFGGSGDSVVAVRGAKRGLLATGDGDDQITVVARSNDRVAATNQFGIAAGGGDDAIRFQGAANGGSRSRIDGGDGADRIVLANRGADVVVLAAGQVEGDRIEGFDGGGARPRDVLRFVGYGPDAVLTALGGGSFRVEDGILAETFTLLAAQGSQGLSIRFDVLFA